MSFNRDGSIVSPGQSIGSCAAMWNWDYRHDTDHDREHIFISGRPYLDA